MHTYIHTYVHTATDFGYRFRSNFDEASASTRKISCIYPDDGRPIRQIGPLSIRNGCAKPTPRVGIAAAAAADVRCNDGLVIEFRRIA